MRLNDYAFTNSDGSFSSLSPEGNGSGCWVAKFRSSTSSELKVTIKCPKNGMPILKPSLPQVTE